MAGAGYYSDICGFGKLYYFGDGVETDNSEAYPEEDAERISTVGDEVNGII